MSECLYSPCTELYSPGIEMSLKTISQRVSPDQGCYSVCIGYQYYRVVTVLEIGFMVCSPTYLAILHCTLKMLERADILSYIFTITQTMQKWFRLWTLLLENQSGVFPLLIWVLKKQRCDCRDCVVCLVKV